MRFRLPPFVVVLLAVLLLAATIRPLPAQPAPPQNSHSIDAKGVGNTFQIGPNWLFQAGNNPAWAAADFDDSKWPVVTSAKGSPTRATRAPTRSSTARTSASRPDRKSTRLNSSHLGL